jgi:glycerol-3-phosphate acyltransferase PlsY
VITLNATLAVGYLFGAIPSAALAARAAGVRIFEIGSGNMGAMNTLRNLGRGWGLLVLMADIGKGAAAVGMAMAMGRFSGLEPAGVQTAGLLAGFGAVLGHAYSVFVGWRGGKGLATMLGVSLPLYPLGGLAGLAMLIALWLLTRRPHLSAVLALLLYPAVVVLSAARAGGSLESLFALVTGVIPLSLLALLQHARQRSPFR